MMNSKIKKIAISYITIIIVNLAFSSKIFWTFGITSPHVGFLYVLGLLFGPYGALGAALGNITLDLIYEYTPIQIIPSAIISFGVSYLAYKLWYSGFKAKKITKPRLDTIYHLNLFLFSILVCGFIYSVGHGNLTGIFFGDDIVETQFVIYLFNFINIAFIFGIIGIWLSKRIDLIETPKKSESPVNKKLYRTLFCLLSLVVIISIITSVFTNRTVIIAETALIGILLCGYLTKPFEFDIEPSDENTVIEKIIKIFIRITLAFAILGVIFSVFNANIIENMDNVNLYLFIMPVFIITDAVIISFYIPGIIILRYVEKNVIRPISAFSEIEKFIKENEKIESEGLVDVYSEYVNEKTEIGTLARSYTELINHNNNYIENIHEIEGEKERIKAELDIAEKIQAAKLPKEALNNEDYTVNGYSHPAKEVGGDFFDYYELDDDNLAIVIGDASGKGVPAALLSMITQVMIKQILNHNQDPSKVLYLLNNQLCENNSETMFITLWLGIYNKTTKRLTFSNAGHNPPLIKENDEFRYLSIDSGIVLGVLEDFEYVKEEISLTDELILYTDGITDANNGNDERYGEDRLVNFFNAFYSDDDPIRPLLKDINDFTGKHEQFDDMTLLYLRIK